MRCLSPLATDEYQRYSAVGVIVKDGSTLFPLPFSARTTPAPRQQSAETQKNSLPSYEAWKQQGANEKLPSTPRIPSTIGSTEPSATPGLATHAQPRDHRHQYVNELNSRVQYAIDQLQVQEQQAFKQLWKHICELHNENVAIVLAILRFDPSAAMRLWLKKENLHAKFVGEAIQISGCKTVKPETIFWNHQINGTCYNLTPVSYNGTILFVQAGSRELIRKAEVIPCNKCPTAIYQHQNGSWRSMHGNVDVASLSQHMAFKHNRQPVELRAPDIFNSETDEIATSLSLFSSYSQKINRLERIVVSQGEPKSSFGKTLTSAMETVADNIEGFASNVTGPLHWISEAAASATSILGSSKQLSRNILALAILGIALFGSCYAYSWLYPFLPKRRRRRGHIRATHFSTTCQRYAKYRT